MMVVTRRVSRRTLSLPVLTLMIIFVASLALRLYAINWDRGADLHPDELFVAKIVLIDRIHLNVPADLGQLLDPATSGLNPRSADPATGRFREFAYGALPLWITDFVAWILSRVTGVNWNASEHAYLVGRAISAVLSALTVVIVAALGRAAGGFKVGLVAALFAGLAPMSVQLAHFFTTDSWLSFFVSLCLLACVAAANRGDRRWFAAAGATLGLAMATKGSVFSLAIPVATALIFDLTHRWEDTERSHVLWSSCLNAAAAAGAAAIAFFAFEPYALLRPDVYLQSLRTQADIVSGTFDVPFTRVYAGTTPIIYQLEQFVLWGYGPVAGLVALTGIPLLLLLAWRRGSAATIILVSWLIAYGSVITVSEVKFLRYLEPLSPVFAISAALSVVAIGRALCTPRVLPIARVLPPVLLVASAVWTGAFLSIYAHENSRLEASRWIFESVPPGATLTTEYWDDALPKSLGFALSPSTFGFGLSTLDLYRDDPPQQASDAIYNVVSDADFIVQSSQRVESAIAAEPWRYPVQDRFYDLLGRGQLGFQRAASFVPGVSIGNVTLDDSDADESFVNYDHPRVSIYEASEPLTRSDYDQSMSWALQRPWFPNREPPNPTLLLNTPVGENPSVGDGRWSAAATTSDPVAFVVWIVLLLVLLAVGIPITSVALRGFPDLGWGLARIAALVIAAYPVWLGASLRVIRFQAVWVILALAAVGVAGWRAAGFGGRRLVLGAESSRLWMHAEVAFWVVFALFLAFRLIVPDGWHPFWGGEKPMEFAQINAIERSASFPPYDPWYADGYINYYYYGFYLIAFLFKATGIPPEIGFNLALPTVMAMLASGGFSVAAALAHGLTRSRRWAIVAGWLGVLSLSVLGNLSALRALAEESAAQFDPFLHWVWQGSRAIDNAITEFPFFSGLYADLHSHVIALPITVLTVAVCLALVLDANQEPIADLTWWPRGAFLMRLVLLSLLLGTLSATNAWDVPVYAALATVCLVMATPAAIAWQRRLLHVLSGGLVLLIGGWALFLPFRSHFVALFGQLAVVHDPTDMAQFFTHFGGFLAISSIGLVVLLCQGNQRCGAAWGLTWLVPVLGLLGMSVILASVVRGQTLGSGVAVVALLTGPPAVAAWGVTSDAAVSRTVSLAGRALLVVGTLAAIAAAVNGRSVFALLLLFGVVAGTGWLCLQSRAERFVSLLLAAGSLTAAGTELFVVADDLINTSAYRMNTVFKFYNQVWVLFSLATVAIVGLMLSLAFRRNALASSDPVPIAWPYTGLVVSSLILLVSLGYPLLATEPRLAQRFAPGTESGTLNALGWMAEGTVPSYGMSGSSNIRYDGDRAAIKWLNENVHGSPVVAEASIGPYRCNGSRISSATGLPTIIGWERHEQQQRYPDTLPARVDDVRTLYTSPDVAEKTSILRRYNVEYVVVGDLERLYPEGDNDCTPTGSAAGINAFADMVGTVLEVAFQSTGTTIYRVLPIGGT